MGVETGDDVGAGEELRSQMTGRSAKPAPRRSAASGLGGM